MDSRYLFRGKRLDSGEWVHGCLLKYAYGILICDNRLPYDNEVDVDPATLGQCTGLSAAKSYRGESAEDTMVYEGDIVWLRHCEKKAHVYWDLECGAWHLRFGVDDVDLLSNYFYEVDVIGTIHDTDSQEGAKPE